MAICSLLQDALELVAEEYKVVALHITVQHTTFLCNWLFAKTAAYNLVTSLLLFTITPPRAVSIDVQVRLKQDHTQTADYMTIMDGNTSITASDTRALCASNAFVPLLNEEIECTLEASGALLVAGIDSKHLNILAHFESLAAYKEVKGSLNTVIRNKVGATLDESELGLLDVSPID